MEQYATDVGPVIIEGKTKILFASKSDPYAGYARNKDIVTWADKYSRPMLGKGEWSTRVNHNVLELFKKASLPVAYLGRMDETTFKTELCDMFPFEVVACGIVDAKSSFRKRNPNIPAETYFKKPVVQFHLKTSGRTYRGRELPCDDPLMVIGTKEVAVYLPSKPIEDQEAIFTVPLEEAPGLFPGFEHIDEMTFLTEQGFDVARTSYVRVDGKLYDFKEEYGRARRPELRGKVVKADVLDADSMRLTVRGARADKQPIRDGGEEAAPAQAAAYRLAAETSDLLTL